MMHNPMMKMICMITWPITALYSLNALTTMWGYDGMAWCESAMPGMVVAFAWIIGLSGLVSLVAFVQAMFMCCPGCGSCPCTCNKESHRM